MARKILQFVTGSARLMFSGGWAYHLWMTVLTVLVVSGILAYARADADGTTLEPVNLNELVREVIDLLDPPESFRIEVDPDLPVLTTARSPLQKIFSNA